jgi:hypothetical protein
LTGIGGRAAAAALRPLAGVGAAAMASGIELERRTVERVLASAEFEGFLSGALDNQRVQLAIKRALESEGAKQLVATFFDSGLFDEVADRLLASPALWRLIDEIADSPAVTAAITQQSLGFADQIGDEVRTRSRNADDWLDRAAQRLKRKRRQADPPLGGLSPGSP